MDDLIITYGYPILFLGSFLEGETVLVAAGFLANRGYLRLDLVMLVAFIGAYIGDVTLFFIGRKKGRGLVYSVHQLRVYYKKAKKLFDKYGVWMIFITRYLYGLRFASAAFCGIMRMKPLKYLPLNFISCTIWAVVIGGLGYLFGKSLQTLLGNIRHYEQYIFILIIAIGFFLWVFKRKKTKSNDKTEQLPHSKD